MSVLDIPTLCPTISRHQPEVTPCSSLCHTLSSPWLHYVPTSISGVATVCGRDILFLVCALHLGASVSVQVFRVLQLFGVYVCGERLRVGKSVMGKVFILRNFAIRFKTEDPTEWIMNDGGGVGNDGIGCRRWWSWVGWISNEIPDLLAYLGSWYKKSCGPLI